MATVTADPAFDPESVSEGLRKAMKGLGTDEKAIIAALTSVSNEQRLMLVAAYKQMYGRDLVDDLKSELGGKLEKVVLALMTKAAFYDARELKAAMKGVGTDEACLIEILASRSNAEIGGIRAAYKKEFGGDLEGDLTSETSGHFKRLLVSLANACRDESTDVDADHAKANAQALVDAGVKKWGTDESMFNRILCTLSHAQLRLVFDEYQALTGKSIEASIKSEMSGDLEDGFLAIVQCARSKTDYFAQRLYRSMKGAGTDDPTLIRVIVSRCEVDLADIKVAFENAYGKPLAKAFVLTSAATAKMTSLTIEPSKSIRSRLIT